MKHSGNRIEQSPIKTNRPIILIGAGGIVNDAHLPAYLAAGFNVHGIYDINGKKAAETAKKFAIPIVYHDLEQLLTEAPANTVFDAAIPANGHLLLLQKLPENSVVLLQKPMGENYASAQEILSVSRSKKIIAAVNFQLRYAPCIAIAREIISSGLIGELCDIEININVYTPWQLWKFLYSSPRVEILYHSIHYIDLVRSFLGNPQGIYAKTVKHPQATELASVRSNIILDYGDLVRANILTNHCHAFGPENQQSYVKFEGTTGAVKVQLGALLNYPSGLPDRVSYIITADHKQPVWQHIEVTESWFPHAFIGSMNEIMKAAEGEIDTPDNSVEDCIYTMACVEAAYQSSQCGSVKLNDIQSLNGRLPECRSAH